MISYETYLMHCEDAIKALIEQAGFTVWRRFNDKRKNGRRVKYVLRLAKRTVSQGTTQRKFRKLSDSILRYNNALNGAGGLRIESDVIERPWIEHRIIVHMEQS